MKTAGANSIDERWPVAAALVAGTTAWISSDLLALPREIFVLPYALFGAALVAMFVRMEDVDARAVARRHPMRAVVVTAIVGALAIASVLAQPGAPRASGPRLAFELIWYGVVYGTVDGVLLTVIPMSGVLRASDERRWSSDAIAFASSLLVFIAYHLGFPEFRGAAIAGPVVAGVLFGVAYLVARNPLVPIVAHVAMHVAAVLHGPAGTMQLPPHY